MLKTQDLLGGLQRETDIVKHLATKVPVGTLDWRPTAQQRSTGELLEYLTVCATAPAYAMLDGNWDRGKAAEADLQSHYAPEAFADCMDRQMACLRALLSEVTPEDAVAKTTKLPWGEEVPLGVALVEAVWKTFTTYRTQLFLYAKESGASGLTSQNLWMGRDATPPAP